MRRRGVIGSPATVRAGIEEIASRYGAEEVIVVNISYDHGARRRSYELIAEAFGVGAARDGRGACRLRTAAAEARPRSSRGYRAAFIDWTACAVRGRPSPPRARPPRRATRSSRSAPPGTCSTSTTPTSRASRT